MKHLVFVYGTLKRGYGNNGHLINSEFIGEARVVGQLRTFSYIPVFTSGVAVVIGEIFKVTDEVLKDMDRLEGIPSFYNRKKINALCDDKEIECWIYYMDYEKVKDLEIVKGGEWKG